MRKYSQLKKSIFFGIFLLVFYFGGSFLLSFIFKHFNIKLTTIQAVLVSQLGLVLVPVIIYFIVTRDSLIKTLKLYPINLPCLIKVILFSFCIQPLVMTISAIGNLVFTNYTTSTMLSLSSSLPYPVMLLLAAVLPAFIEEISTRGIILSGFKGMLAFPAAIVNGLIFAILHGNIQQGLYAFVLGFIFVYLVNAAGSIAASMTAHFIVNATFVTMIYAMSGIYDNLDAYYARTSAQSSSVLGSPEMAIAIVMLLVLVAGFTFLAYLLYRSIKNQGRTFFKDRSNTITI